MGSFHYWFQKAEQGATNPKDCDVEENIMIYTSTDNQLEDFSRSPSWELEASHAYQAAQH